MSDETWFKVNERKAIKEKLMNATTRQQKKTLQDLYSTKDEEVKKSCKQDKRKYVEQLAEEAESACGKGDIKTLYSSAGKHQTQTHMSKTAMTKLLPNQKIN